MKTRKYFQLSLFFVLVAALAGCAEDQTKRAARRAAKRAAKVEAKRHAKMMNLGDGIHMFVNAIEAPDSGLDKKKKYQIRYIDKDTQIEGKYVLTAIKAELYRKDFEQSKVAPDLVILVQATEGPIEYEIPAKSYLAPIFIPGSEASVYSGFTKVGSVKTDSSVSMVERTIPAQREVTNGRYIYIWVYRPLKSKNDEPEMVWKGSVNSAGDEKLMDVYQGMVSELMSEFSHPSEKERERFRYKDGSPDSPDEK